MTSMSGVTSSPAPGERPVTVMVKSAAAVSTSGDFGWLVVHPEHGPVVGAADVAAGHDVVVAGASRSAARELMSNLSPSRNTCLGDKYLLRS
jgi:hypothetical protein